MTTGGRDHLAYPRNPTASARVGRQRVSPAPATPWGSLDRAFPTARNSPYSASWSALQAVRSRARPPVGLGRISDHQVRPRPNTSGICEAQGEDDVPLITLTSDQEDVRKARSRQVAIEQPHLSVNPLIDGTRRALTPHHHGVRAVLALPLDIRLPTGGARDIRPWLVPVEHPHGATLTGGTVGIRHFKIAIN